MKTNYILIFINILYFTNGQYHKCKNQYAAEAASNRRGTTKRWGREAIYENQRDRYDYRERVTFRCQDDYMIYEPVPMNGAHYFTVCLFDGNWSVRWPMCRSTFENVTCENEYANRLRKTSKNAMHALYSGKRTNYPHQTMVTFRCPHGYTVQGSHGHQVMQSTCNDEGDWSPGWPMCQDTEICPELVVTNGYIADEDVHRRVGVNVRVHCKPGYYLWGEPIATCLSSHAWSGLPRECVTGQTFKRYCHALKKPMLIEYGDKNKQPYCYSESIKKEEAKTPFGIIGISVMTVFIILCLTIGATFMIRRHRQRLLFIAEAEQMLVRPSERSTRTRPNIIELPSYDDVLKDMPTTPPPTFEEIYGEEQEESTSFIQPSEEEPLAGASTVREPPPAYTEA